MHVMRIKGARLKNRICTQIDRFSMRLILNYNCVQEFKIEELYNLKTY